MIRVLIIILGLLAAAPQIRGPVLTEEGPLTYATINVSAIGGIHQNSNLSTGGGTDDTSLIQAVLNAHSRGGLTLVQDGVSLITGLNLYSNQTIQCADQVHGFYLANSSNREMIRNVHRSTGSIQDSNITLNGCYYNGNKSNQTVPQADNTPVAGMGFYGISNLVVKNLTVFNAAEWEMGIGNFFNVSVHDCSFLSAATTGSLTTDGIDFRGPSSGASLNNLTIKAGDDAVALNSRAYSSGVIGPFISGGDINNVSISNITLQDDGAGQGTWAGVDLISNGGFSIRDIYMSNIHGSVQNYAFYLNRDFPDAPGTQGTYSNIYMTGMNVSQLGTPFGGVIPAGLYLIDGLIDSLTVDNFTPQAPTISLPTSNGVITALKFYDHSRGSFTGPTTVPSPQPAYVGSAEVPFASSVSSIAVTKTGVVTGDLLIALTSAFKSGGFTFSSIGDSRCPSWTLQQHFDDGATGHGANLYTCIATSSGSDTVTVTFGSVVTAAELGWAEYSQIAPSPVDATTGITFGAQGTTVSAPAVTASLSYETVYGIGWSDGSTATAGSGYTMRLSGTGNAFILIEDKQLTTSGSNTPTWTDTGAASVYTTSMTVKGIAQGTSWTISGNAGVNGGTITYSGTASGTVTADTFGNYQIPSLANGAYTITPSLGGNTFTPTSASVTISSADVTGIVFTSP